MNKLALILAAFIVCQMTAGQERYETLLKAGALTDAGKNEASAAMLTVSLNGAPDLEMYLLRGQNYLGMSETEKARKDFSAAEALSPGSGALGLARCAAVSGDARTAVSWLESHLKSSWKKSEPELILDPAFARITSTPEWRSLWKKEWYSGYERRTWEITSAINSGRIDLAEESLSALEADYPDMPLTALGRARVLTAGGSFGEASAILSPYAEQADAAPEFLLAYAASMAGEGNYYKSATLYKRLIDSQYPQADLYLKRAQMLLKTGDRSAAKADLTRYLEINPESSEALGLLGRSYAEEGDIYGALPLLNANIENHPGEAGAFSLRGDAWLAAKSWGKAVEDYTMSLDLDPQNGEVNLGLAIALINSGKADDACYYLRKAKALGQKEATQYLSRYCIR